MANEHKIPEIIRSSLENIRAMVDANTIVGEPITAAGGTVIIPISKISMGVASGGIDYNSKKDAQPRPQNFGGGGGTGLSITPVGFLVCDSDGGVDFLSIADNGKSDPIDQIADIIERTPDIIARLKDIFTKNKGSSASFED